MPINLFDTPLFQTLLKQPAPRSGAVPLSYQRQYASAQPSRLSLGAFGSANTSADSELVSGLRQLRARSRQLVRDAAFAKNARRIIVNNVIGTGIKLQASVQNSRSGLHEAANDAIEKAFEAWCAADSCHTGGKLHFHELERFAMGQVFEAGEIFIRIHRSKFGRSTIPMALEVIEPERLMDGYEQPAPGPNTPAYSVRMGVEMDEFNRPVAYWVRRYHPGDIRFAVERIDRFERVPAADMFHLHIVDRWPQTRGEPWMHAISRKLNDMDGYSEAEIIAARGSASYVATIKSPESSESFGEVQTDGSTQEPIEPGMIKRLLPGEEMDFISPNRPNAALDPFMRFMLREVAAGIGVSYESLSRDYSQSNYSSSRLAVLDDRDCWKSLQLWFIRSFRVRLHQEWLQAAVLAGAVSKIDLMQYAQDPCKYECAKFRPRGWSWIDPDKEVNSFGKAVKSGFMSVTDVIAATSGGQDLEDIMETRADELAYMKELGLAFDTSPDVYVPAETRGQMVNSEEGVEPAAQEVAANAGGQKPVADDGDGKDMEDAADTASDPQKPARILRAVRQL